MITEKPEVAVDPIVEALTAAVKDQWPQLTELAKANRPNADFGGLTGVRVQMAVSITLGVAYLQNGKETQFQLDAQILLPENRANYSADADAYLKFCKAMAAALPGFDQWRSLVVIPKSVS